jgi:hypothetical protein
MKTPTPEQLQKDTAAMFEHVANFGGGPAHPQQIQYGMTDGVPNIWFAVGLTKRERFAMAAMQGMLSCWESQQKICNDDPRYQQKTDGQFNFSEVLAMNAVEFADALLERLKQ